MGNIIGICRADGGRVLRWSKREGEERMTKTALAESAETGSREHVPGGFLAGVAFIWFAPIL